MNRNTLKYCMLMGLAAFFASCAFLPFNKQVKVAESKPSAPYIEAGNVLLNDGSTRKNISPVVFSDRENNSTQVSIGNDMADKKLAFLEPLYIIKTKGDFVKVTGYDAAVNLKETKGRLKKKSLKFTGWITKDKLLLWTGALKEGSTFFTAKAITNVASAGMMENAEKYFSNDSLLLFTSPGLLKPASKKIAVGQLVYIYKQSADKKSYLIGAEPFVTAENIAQSMLGWMSINAITIWGAKAAFTLKPVTTDTATGLFATEQQAAHKGSVPLLAANRLAERTAFENIFPIHSTTPDSIIKTSYLENILDYSKNKVFNVLGKPIYYNRYREIVSNANKLNIVFVVDGGPANRLYLPSVKSVLQGLQLYFDTTTSFKTAKFGAVVYKNTKCATDTIADSQKLTGNYADIINFIDRKQKLTDCDDANIYQSVNGGIIDACNLLGSVKSETNIIIVIGTTGTENANLENTVAAISKVQARLMYFQTISKSPDAYNDFVLSAEKAVIASSQNIAELKKEKLVDQNDVIANPLYSLQAGDQGIYYLDYPSKSMTQGYVLYPKKGEAMLPGILKNNFDSLLYQVIADNKKVTGSLHTYFKSNMGVNNTNIKSKFATYMPFATTPLPISFASSFISIDNGFFIPAYIKPDSTVNYGVLLTEAEYDKQALYFSEIFKLSGVASDGFSKRSAINKYIHFLKKYTATHAGKMSRGKIKALTAKEALQLFTGYISKDSLSNTTTLLQLKRSDKVTGKMMLAFFNRFKYSADAMQENKNTAAVRINCKGTYYYWVEEKLMP